MLSMKDAARLLQKPHNIKSGDIIRTKYGERLLGVVLSVHKDQTYKDIDRYYLKFSLLKDPSDIRTQWVGNVELYSK